MTGGDDDTRLHIELDEQGTIRIVGEIDMSNSAAARERLVALVPDDAPVVIDLSGVTYLGSHGLTTLVGLHNVALARGVPMVVVTGATNLIVQRVLGLSGLGQLFRIVAESDEVPAQPPPGMAEDPVPGAKAAPTGSTTGSPEQRPVGRG